MPTWTQKRPKRDVKQSWQPKHRQFNAHHWHIKGWLYSLWMLVYGVVCDYLQRWRQHPKSQEIWTRQHQGIYGTQETLNLGHQGNQTNQSKASKYTKEPKKSRKKNTQNQRNPKQRDHTKPPSQPMETTGPDMRNQGKCQTCHSTKKHEDLYNFNHNSFQRGELKLGSDHARHLGVSFQFEMSPVHELLSVKVVAQDLQQEKYTLKIFKILEQIHANTHSSGKCVEMWNICALCSSSHSPHCALLTFHLTESPFSSRKS